MGRARAILHLDLDAFYASVEQLDDPGLRPDGITVRSVLDRLAERGDPFRTVLADQELPPLR